MIPWGWAWLGCIGLMGVSGGVGGGGPGETDVGSNHDHAQNPSIYSILFWPLYTTCSRRMLDVDALS